MVSILSSDTKFAFQGRCIQLFKQIHVEVTFMIFWEEIKYIARKQQVLIKFRWAFFEGDGHGLI